MTIPTLDDLQPSRRGLPSGVARDLLALAMILLGLVGLVVTAFVAHVLLGAAVVSLVVLGVGVALGIGR